MQLRLLKVIYMHSYLEKSKKGLALRDITNQTPHLKTIKKTVKKTVNAVKKVADEKKSVNAVKKVENTSIKTVSKKSSVVKFSNGQKTEVSDILKNNGLDILQEIEYMPPNPIPIEFTNEKYKMDLSCLKATSKGCIFTKPNFKNFLDEEFKQEDINFNTDSDLFVLDPDDSFLYF